MISSLLPDAVVGPLAFLALAISLALSTTSAWLSVAMGAVAASILTGLPRDDVAGFAADASETGVTARPA